MKITVCSLSFDKLFQIVFFLFFQCFLRIKFFLLFCQLLFFFFLFFLFDDWLHGFSFLDSFLNNIIMLLLLEFSFHSHLGIMLLLFLLELFQVGLMLFFSFLSSFSCLRFFRLSLLVLSCFCNCKSFLDSILMNFLFFSFLNIDRCLHSFQIIICDGI